MTTGAVVLAGGRSRRMGTDKAVLEWHGRPLVAHVSEKVLEVIDGPVVVVAALDQELPPLPQRVERVVDAVADQGPLEGIRTGLEALTGRAELALVWSVDAPNVRPELIQLLVGALGDADAVVPCVDGFTHPLSAVYRISLLPVVERLLADGERRARAIVDRCTAVLLDERALRAVDPELHSLIDFDTPDELEAARRVI